MSSKRSTSESIDALRLKSRQQYLSKREEVKLAELRKQVQEEAEEERTNPHLSQRELREFSRNRETLRLAESRLAIDDHLDGYILPDADYSNKNEVLTRRHKDRVHKSEVEAWEEEQSTKAKATQFRKPSRETETDYEFVFDAAQEVKWDTNIKLIDPEKQALQAQLDAAEKKAKTIEETRQNLPIYKYKDEIIAAIKEHRVIVLVSETGSGKTTQVPRFVNELNEGNGDFSRMVGCTQPRRVAAMSVAARVAEEMGTKLGHKVGYSIRFEDKTSERTRIKYMTDGMLLRELMSNPSLDNYSCMMIDEAHERTVNTDIIMAILKDISRATDLRLIISSATLNAQAFSRYFDDAPIFNCPGRTHNVAISYTQAAEANYLSAAVTTIFQIHLSQPAGDILVFLTGQDEIEAAQANIEETARKLGSSSRELLVCPLYSALSSELQNKVFEPTPPGARKVVLSTNIAETSVTIDGIFWVIDSGFEKQNQYNQQTGLSSLVITPISRASAAQRAGRAGRTGPGTCLRLFQKWAYYNELPETTPPEIQRVKLSGPVLLLKSLNINDLLNFDFLDPPSPEALIASLEELYSLGALTSSGELSVIGRRMAEFPLDPKLSRAILEADKLGCVDEVLTIVAMIGESGALFLRPKDKKLHADAARNRFVSKEGGDHITLLNIFNAFQESDYDSMWCKENFLQYRSLTRARDVRDQLVKLCDRVEVNSSSAGTDNVLIRKALTAGYFSQSARLSRNGLSYRTVTTGMEVFIHPSSTMVETRSKLVIYSEMVLTSKEYMRNVMPCEQSWLSELAPHYFKKGEIEKLGLDKKMPKGQGKVGVDGR